MKGTQVKVTLARPPARLGPRLRERRERVAPSLREADPRGWGRGEEALSVSQKHWTLALGVDTVVGDWTRGAESRGRSVLHAFGSPGSSSASILARAAFLSTQKT